MTGLDSFARSHSIGPHFCGELTDAENSGRPGRLSWEDLAAGALGGRPSAARPDPTA
jgi:hypothetical protein